MAKPFKPAPTSAPAAKPSFQTAPGKNVPPTSPSAAAAGRSDTRNSPLPKSASQPPAGAGGKREITREMIAKRAYEIWQSGKGGSEYDNWIRAERELRGS